MMNESGTMADVSDGEFKNGSRVVVKLTRDEYDGKEGIVVKNHTARTVSVSFDKNDKIGYCYCIAALMLAEKKEAERAS